MLERVRQLERARARQPGQPGRRLLMSRAAPPWPVWFRLAAEERVRSRTALSQPERRRRAQLSRVPSPAWVPRLMPELPPAEPPVPVQRAEQVGRQRERLRPEQQPERALAPARQPRVQDWPVPSD